MTACSPPFSAKSYSSYYWNSLTWMTPKKKMQSNIQSNRTILQADVGQHPKFNCKAQEHKGQKPAFLVTSIFIVRQTGLGKHGHFYDRWLLLINTWDKIWFNARVMLFHSFHVMDLLTLLYCPKLKRWGSSYSWRARNMSHGPKKKKTNSHCVGPFSAPDPTRKRSRHHEIPLKQKARPIQRVGEKKMLTAGIEPAAFALLAQRSTD